MYSVCWRRNHLTTTGRIPNGESKGERKGLSHQNLTDNGSSQSSPERSIMFKLVAVFMTANFLSSIAFLEDAAYFRRSLKNKFTKNNDSHQILSSIREKQCMQCRA